MESSTEVTSILTEVCLLAGRIMAQNGAETSRVEDTMIRIATAGKLPAQSFVTPTGILFSLGWDNRTHLVRLVERSVNLRKVTEVNTLSRQFCDGQLSLEAARDALKQLDQAKFTYPMPLQIFMAAVTSGGFLFMFQGIWQDFGTAFLCGGIGFSLVWWLHRLTRVKFFAEFSASLALAFVALGLVHLGIGQGTDKIIIAAVMPLVPGLLITNAVRDLMAGHLMAGMAKGMEALLTAMAIGAGVAVALSVI